MYIYNAVSSDRHIRKLTRVIDNVDTMSNGMFTRQFVLANGTARGFWHLGMTGTVAMRNDLTCYRR